MWVAYVVFDVAHLCGSGLWMFKSLQTIMMGHWTPFDCVSIIGLHKVWRIRHSGSSVVNKYGARTCKIKLAGKHPNNQNGPEGADDDDIERQAMEIIWIQDSTKTMCVRVIALINSSFLFLATYSVITGTWWNRYISWLGTDSNFFQASLFSAITLVIRVIVAVLLIFYSSKKEQKYSYSSKLAFNSSL